MKPPVKLIFWQPFLSFHQEGFYRALIQQPWVDSVVFRVESNLPPERIRSGWREVDARGLLVEPIVAEYVPEQDADVVHFFTGFGTHPLIWNAFDRIPIHADCRVFAYTEAPDLTGAAGVLRRWKYHFMARKLAPKLDGILAIGSTGEAFYRSIPGKRIPIHRFGYYDALELPQARPSETPAADGAFRMLYAGQFIRRKGVDRLLRALAPLKDEPWRLDLVGDGPEKGSLIQSADALGLTSKITFQAPLANKELAKQYLNVDCVLLPSRWDGWGMTVNEALRAGCPVLATSTCGAADLLPPDWILPPQESQWTSRIANLLNSGDPVADREKAFAHARETTGTAGVERLKNILQAS